MISAVALCVYQPFFRGFWFPSFAESEARFPLGELAHRLAEKLTAGVWTVDNAETRT